MTFRSEIEHEAHRSLLAGVKAALDEIIGESTTADQRLMLLAGSKSTYQSLLSSGMPGSSMRLPFRVMFEFGPVLDSAELITEFSVAEFGTGE